MAPENWSNIRLPVEKKVTLWDGSGFLQEGDLANDQLSESEITLGAITVTRLPTDVDR